MKKQPRNEFRDHKKSGHPAYIYEKVGDEYRFIGITHSPITRGIKNIPLEQNPDPNNTQKAFLKKKPEQDKTRHFKERKKGWRFSKKDQEKVKKIRSAPSKSKN